MKRFLEIQVVLILIVALPNYAHAELRGYLKCFFNLFDPKKMDMIEQFSSLEKRSFPSGSSKDTLINGQFLHESNIPFISDEEVLEVYPLVRQKIFSDKEQRKVQVGYVADGKSVIRQIGKRSCSITSASMLIQDANRPIDIRWLYEENLGTTDSVMSDIKRAGLEPILTTFNTRELGFLQKLKEVLEQRGSGVAAIGGELGGHSIVLDSFDGKDFILRDPYHGWKIRVPMNALLKRWMSSRNFDVVQLKNHN